MAAHIDKGCFRLLDLQDFTGIEFHECPHENRDPTYFVINVTNPKSTYYLARWYLILEPTPEHIEHAKTLFEYSATHGHKHSKRILKHEKAHDPASDLNPLLLALQRSDDEIKRNNDRKISEAALNRDEDSEN
jgi:hypothetical protein